MKTIILTTEKVLSGDSKVQNATYINGDNELVKIFSHSSVNDMSEFRYTTLDKIESICPAVKNLISGIDKQKTNQTFFFDFEEKRWK